MIHKQAVIDEVARNTGLPKSTVKVALDDFVDLIAETLQESGQFRYPGLGTLAAHKRAGRMGVNPATGAPLAIGPKGVVKFMPDAKLRRSAQHHHRPPGVYSVCGG